MRTEKAELHNTVVNAKVIAVNINSNFYFHNFQDVFTTIWSAVPDIENSSLKEPTRKTIKPSLPFWLSLLFQQPLYVYPYQIPNKII